MYLFIDDYKTTSGAFIKNDFFSYGGLLVKKEKLKELETRFNSVKDSYNIPAYLPLKWNFKDTSSMKMYRSFKKHKLWKETLPISKDIRMDILRLLAEVDAKVIFACFRKLKRTKILPNKLSQWALTNIIQRAYFETTPIEIIIDWEDKERNLLSESYLWPYYFGKGRHDETFLPYCMNNLQSGNPYISYSVTIYNPFLQIADIAVGCCGNFVGCCLKGNNRPLAVETFEVLVKSIRGYKSGNIFSWGFLISPSEDKVRVERELIKLGFL